MSPKFMYYLAATVGSIVGAYLPLLWGGSTFSTASILLSGVGGVAGIIFVYKRLS